MALACVLDVQVVSLHRPSRSHNKGDAKKGRYKRDRRNWWENKQERRKEKTCHRSPSQKSWHQVRKRAIPTLATNMCPFHSPGACSAKARRNSPPPFTSRHHHQRKEESEFRVQFRVCQQSNQVFSGNAISLPQVCYFPTRNFQKPNKK
jgi:hypothetical protein